MRTMTDHLGFIHPVKLGKLKHTTAFLVLKKPCEDLVL
jgi:hypothetical protein